MTIILEHKSGYRLGAEESLLARHLDDLGSAYEIAPLSDVERGRVDCKQAVLVAGSIPFIKAALRQRGVSLPPEQSYPPVLRHLLKRRIWPSTVGRAREQLEISPQPFFIKPSVRAKRFTGFVMFDCMDIRLGGVPKSEKVWCSEVVSWVSEWRLYVAGGRVLHAGHYDGKPEVEPAPEVVEEALSLMSSQDGCPSAYALDIGVLDNGQTALIEVNDAYGIGAYGIDADLYYSFLSTRWDELCAVQWNS